MIPFFRSLFPHPYLRFRMRLAHYAMLQFVASLQSSMEIVLLAAGPVLLGLLACIALPGLFAATQSLPTALGLLTGQTLIAAAPVLLLRKRLLPMPAVSWSQPLPIGLALRWRADAAVAGMVAGPMALAYAISCAIWLYQWPDWLRPVAPQALGLTLLSLLLAWGLSTLALARRGRLPQAVLPKRTQAPPTHYLPRPAGALLMWQRLFWLPFWRADNPIGTQQSMLLAAAVASVATWIAHPSLVPPTLWGASASLAVMLLTDRGDKAVTEQIALLRPIAAAWPMAPQRLFMAAILFSLLPGLAVTLLFGILTLGHVLPGAGPRHSPAVAIVWLCGSVLAQCALVGLRRLSLRGRVSLVMGAILLLTAIGSELWN